ncbi:MAG: sensor histidine kinase [Saprospiraceae bacterium]
MDTAFKKNIRRKIWGFFSNPWVSHSIFWGLLLWILVFFDYSQSFTFTMTWEFVNVLFYATIVYFNLYFLIPNYLTEKKFLNYCLLLLASIAVITPIKLVIFYWIFSLFSKSPETIISNQIWHFISIFLAAGTSTLFKIISDWMKYQRDRKDLQTQTMQSELKFLKSQINPHFLFNTLNNLYALTLKKSDKAPEIVIKLSEMMRYMLYECNEKRVLLSKEIHYLKNYLDLEKLRQGKNVEINFEIQGQVLHQKIAPLMFIPFLENSFKHGLSNQIAHGFVNIYLDVQDKSVHLFIENSKPETLPLQEHKRSGGIGLVNVRRRLNLLYPEQYELSIKDNPDSYGVNLIINL